MKKLFAAVLSVAVAVSLSPVVTSAQSTCPAEVAQAKDMLTKKTAAAKADNDQAPRSLAGARQNVAQAPRENQNFQAPRTNEEINQAPRSGAGATTTAQALRANMTKAASLVKQAEAACKAGNLTQASDKAKAALAILK